MESVQGDEELNGQPDKELPRIVLQALENRRFRMQQVTCSVPLAYTKVCDVWYAYT